MAIMMGDENLQATLELLLGDINDPLEDVEFFFESKWQDSQEIIDSSGCEHDELKQKNRKKGGL